MDRPDKTALLSLASGWGSFLIGIAAPIEFPEIPALVGHVLFWGGAIVGVGSLLALADMHLLRARHLPLRLGVPISVTLLLAGAGYERFAHALSPSKYDHTILVACDSEALPKVYPPSGHVHIMIVTRDGLDHNTIAIEDFPGDPGARLHLLPEMSGSFFLCAVTNYGHEPVLQFTAQFKISLKASEVTPIAMGKIALSKLDAGPENAMKFYVASLSTRQEYFLVKMPSSSSLSSIQGAKESGVVLIESMSNDLMLSPAPKREKGRRGPLRGLPG